MNLVIFIILSLAVWRVTKALTNEAGPYKVLERFRNSIINEPWSPIFCFKCTSVWIAFLFTLFLQLDFVTFLLVWFGSSALAIFFETWNEANQEVIIQERKEDAMQV